MNKPITVEVNIEPNLQQDVEQILASLGLSANQAIALFYEQIAKHHGLPFQIDDCNEETLATFAATDRDEDLVVCEDVEDMFSKLGI
ncbi:type II toxin-antitoxin system antitoxin, RelB/DinJ family [Picosynechococcus sp. PCC 11901]|uniref:type II toxin-antitoxin system RelB/DinJ family antitoxin n=1 Tax=Picosynechococcus sp. PCC 11901 TaxID=2579791 RepID=UPI0010FC178F|nr:type II toxin-antitoxin system RelB/DinJ family antitoxin [Picosynechococcus sp. PCC 11901]QCS49617.1 type II toxin-antitoxin system antitoxin, RelB/DinJ family [Picosynechococcus sp. PCC 11901]